MAGGKVTERSIQGPADPVASPPPGAGTSADAGQRAGRQPLGRPAELEGLSTRPASASAAGPVAALPLRRAVLPLLPLAAETLQTEPAKQVDWALKYGATWRTLVHDGRAGTEQRLNLARTGVKHAEAGLRALALLSEQGCLTNDDALRGELFNHRAEAAMAGIQAYHRMLNEEWDAHAQGRGVHSDASAPAACDGIRELLTRGQFQGANLELKRYRAVLDTFVEHCKPGGAPQPLQARLESNLPAVMAGRARCRSAMQSVNVLRIASCAYSLSRLALAMGLLDLTARVGALLEALRHRRDEVAVAVHTLDALAMWHPGAEGEAPPDRPTRPQLAACKGLVRAFRDRLDRIGTHLCMDAAARIEMNDATDLWKAMLDVAQVIADYRANLDALCESVRGADFEPATPSSREDGPGSASEPQPAATIEDRHPIGHGKPPVARPALAAPAPVPRPPDSRTPAQREADDLLRRCQVDAATVSQFRGDVVAIADAFGKDASDLERLMNDREHSAAVTATFMRTSVENWFGKRERLEKAQRGLSAEDPRIGLLTDRLRALDMIGRYVDVWEADASKRALVPKAKHLERLLEMNEVEQVDAPVRLGSGRDKRNRDRVFEIRIQPKPLSDRDQDKDEGKADDRDRARPMFVHLHTSRRIGADALHTLDYRDFDAVHLKLDAQKNLGRNWEEVMRALGYPDMKVERSKVGSELLSRLFALAGRGAASTSAAAGRAGRIEASSGGLRPGGGS
ncbi:type III secretion system effector XopP [Ralstonia solanacearum]|uniref:type III secretion system effector XopP n=1 Tax=Ralstonia solanacearum TaxID=305 RepID=UPI00078D1336|nr:type III secretion system effector XopP [Ralstonia solanacearum]AMP39338.1 type III effector protein (hlk2) [Ralstonia solanacearum]AXV88173.1 type III effector protein (hlk2) [Ralstonia solanacearum]AXW07658.1 type III effector protein (hlk2) [Ralstonia solanacearum]AXW25448.1 type III effector protein (hlk2) [Ralstonia solanacearum]AXW82360.1 type III effector protein (hlk2) [Ralstonia solanacearum]